MTTVVLLFGVLISISGLIICIKPRYITDILNKYGGSSGLHLLAIIIRVIIGIALIFSAADSKYPIVLQILGALMILDALVLIIIGRERFKRLIRWAVNIKSNTQRALGFAGMLFGAFILYAIQ